MLEYLDKLKRNTALNFTANYKKSNKGELVNIYKSYHKGMFGEGIKPQPIKGKGLFSVDKRTQKAKHYYPLGRRIINKSRLIGDNIVMLKQSSGNGISNYPTHSISPKLAKVLVKMTDNSFPTFDEVAELEEMDKNTYLNYVKNAIY